MKVESLLRSHIGRLQAALAALPPRKLARVGEILYRAYEDDKQVFTVGNGGSSSTASHMAADLAMCTARAGRRRLRVLSLSDNSTVLTATANDFGYENVFLEQLKTLIRAGDVLVAISASGNSPSILRVMRYARSEGAEVVALLGFRGGAAAALADVPIVVPSEHYGVIEDVHLVLNHLLVEYLRTRVADGDAHQEGILVHRGHKRRPPRTIR